MSALGVRALTAALAARGIDVPAALARAGIDPAELADPERRIELSRAFPYFELACELTGDAHFGLHAPALAPAGSLEVLEYAVRSCATLAEAYAQLARFYSVVDDRAAMRIEETPDAVVLHYTRPPQIDPPRAAMDFLFAYIVERSRAFIGRAPRLLEVCFRHAEPPGADIQRAFFAAPVIYRAGKDTIAVARESALAPLVARDPVLGSVLGRVLEQMVQRLASHTDILHDVKSAIAAMVSRGAPALDDVARAMKTSGRTLQRRLQESQTRFSDVVAAVQCELSLEYLRDPKLSIAEVAYLVGFADTTSFHRAFRRWTGETPAARRSRP
jgi:AraC-like DNA-binding protein